MNTETEINPQARILAPVDPIEQLIDLDEVARRLDVHKDTVKNMVRDGRFFPPIYVGKLARWRVADLNRWVEERATPIVQIRAAAANSVVAIRDAAERAIEDAQKTAEVEIIKAERATRSIRKASRAVRRRGRPRGA